MCPAHFCNHGALDHHMCQAHDIGARYNCEECGARFSQKQRLVAHARSHKNERPHRCGVCGVAFRRIENLREHMKGVHEGM
ncbi:zinc finger protein-like [Tropilaelaps mercedesae]|uniref:Zinc finger protein-like n=1 Tax=Tropilaelaps mercedesae TaxID=418985 RepID=A0A1V9XAW7_9ACAR|nr:zinc finger protein-like [Tropilaelaps mercedesae]